MSKGHYRAMKELTLNLEINYCTLKHSQLYVIEVHFGLSYFLWPFEPVLMFFLVWPDHFRTLAQK